MSKPAESQADLENEGINTMLKVRQKKRLDKLELKVEQLTKVVTELQQLITKKGKK